MSRRTAATTLGLFWAMSLGLNEVLWLRPILPYQKLRDAVAVPNGMRSRSILFPVSRSYCLLVACFIFPSHYVYKEICPPFRIVILDPYSGSIIEDMDITPAAAGLAWGKWSPLPGSYLSVLGQRLTAGETTYGTLRDLERLSPLVWLAFELDSRSETARGLVQEYLMVFSEVAEIPLLPYYMFLGREFWAWMHTVTGPGPAVT